MPLAWAVPITVRRLCWAKTRSTAIAVGLVLDQHLADAGRDREQTLVPSAIVGRRLHDPDIHEGRPTVGRDVDDADAAPGQPRIDAEHTHEARLSERFVHVFETRRGFETRRCPALLSQRSFLVGVELAPARRRAPRCW